MENIDVLFGGRHLSKISLKILKMNNNYQKVIYDKALNIKFHKGDYNFINDEKEFYKLINNKNNKKFFYICIGDNIVRKNTYLKLKDINNSLFRNILATNIINEINLSRVKGNFILSGCNLDYDVKLGNFNIVNNNTKILHDTKIGDFNFIGPNVTICGSTVIKNNVFIGAGAIICPGIKIGNNSIIGAGAVIRENVNNNTFVVGNPQKIKD